MENDIYLATVSGLREFLGASQPLVSGNGARFTDPRKGKATVYHADIATGNRAEVAFHVASIAQRLAITVPDARSLVEQWRQQTGCAVQINQQHGWPRVGLSSMEHASALLAVVRVRFT